MGTPCLVSHFTDSWGFRPYVAFDKSKGPVCRCAYFLDVVVESQVATDFHVQVLGASN